MKKIGIVVLIIFTVGLLKAQQIKLRTNYSMSQKVFELSNFDIQDTILYLPLGEKGVQVLDIANLDSIKVLSSYTDSEERRGKGTIWGTAHYVKLVDNRLFLSFGDLGLKVLDVSNPYLLSPVGGYYRNKEVYCFKIFKHYAFIGYKNYGFEIIDFSDLQNIKLVARKNIKDFPVKDIQIFEPNVFVSGAKRGLKIFEFRKPFESFKQAGFPRNYLNGNEIYKILIRDKIAYVANNFRGLTVINILLPQYPSEIFKIKTQGRVNDLLIKGNYLYLSCQKAIHVFDITDPEKPVKIQDYIERGRDFKSLKIHKNQLFALYKGGRKNYGIVVFDL